MGGQGIDRREILRYLALASVAGRFAGFSKWVYGGTPSESQQAVAAGGEPSYQPRFFRPDEYRMIEILTELILPRGETPGAFEAGVSEFVDFMASEDERIQVPFRDGLRWLEAHALRLTGKAFAELPGEELSEILGHLAYRERFRPREEEGRAFFRLIRRYTVMGYYTSRIGMQELDSPFLQMVYERAPECPHVDDREHRRL